VSSAAVLIFAIAPVAFRINYAFQWNAGGAAAEGGHGFSLPPGTRFASVVHQVEERGEASSGSGSSGNSAEIIIYYYYLH
jgi:hypothetical protein